MQVSFVRSLFMDSLTQLQLRTLEQGGNLGLSNFFTHYDLIYEPIQKRYHTKAADYYRVKLREAMDTGKQLNEEFLNKDRPSYEEGRLLIQMSRVVSDQKPLGAAATAIAKPA